MNIQRTLLASAILLAYTLPACAQSTDSGIQQVIAMNRSGAARPAHKTS